MSKVKLRPLQLLDKTRLTQLGNNKKIWDNVRDIFPHPYRESDGETFIRLALKAETGTVFGIEFEGELCGVCGLHPQQDVYRKSAEIGYWLGEDFWGKGIATKAIGLLTQYGFEQLGMIRIYAGVFEFNTGSMKVLEKNGYKKEGISRRAILKNGKVWDEHRYAITRSDC